MCTQEVDNGEKGEGAWPPPQPRDLTELTLGFQEQGGGTLGSQEMSHSPRSPTKYPGHLISCITNPLVIEILAASCPYQ